MREPPDSEMERGAGQGTPEFHQPEQTAQTTAERQAPANATGGKASRQCLPGRRQSITQEFEHNGIRVVLTSGYKPNGDVGEIFLNANRFDSTIDVLLSDAAIIISLAVQYGVPLRQLAHSIKRDKAGRASSPIGAALDRISSLDVV